MSCLLEKSARVQPNRHWSIQDAACMLHLNFGSIDTQVQHPLAPPPRLPPTFPPTRSPSLPHGIFYAYSLSIPFPCPLFVGVLLAVQAADKQVPGDPPGERQVPQVVGAVLPGRRANPGAGRAGRLWPPPRCEGRVFAHFFKHLSIAWPLKILFFFGLDSLAAAMLKMHTCGWQLPRSSLFSSFQCSQRPYPP